METCPATIDAEYYANDVKISELVSAAVGVDFVDINMVLEGGSFDVDGNSTLIAAKSSVVGAERNTEIDST